MEEADKLCRQLSIIDFGKMTSPVGLQLSLNARSEPTPLNYHLRIALGINRAQRIFLRALKA